MLDNRPAHYELPDDEVDRLYARLKPVEPPPGFVASVMARVGAPAALSMAGRPAAVARAEAWAEPEAGISGLAGTLAWVVLQVLGACAVGMAAFWLGQAFWTSGAYDLLAVLREDSSLAVTYGDAYLAALVETLPWFELGAVAVALAATALTWIYSRHLLALFGNGEAGPFAGTTRHT